MTKQVKSGTIKTRREVVRLNELGLQILQYRVRNNMSQTDFAAKCRVSRQTVSMLETGRGNHKPTKLVELKINTVLAGGSLE